MISNTIVRLRHFVPFEVPTTSNLKCLKKNKGKRQSSLGLRRNVNPAFHPQWPTSCDCQHILTKLRNLLLIFVIWQIHIFCRQMYNYLLMVIFNGEQNICAWFFQPSESLLSKPSPQLTRGESSWSDSAYVSKVKPSTCTHLHHVCIVVYVCLQNSLRFKNKQFIKLSALSALSLEH